MRRSNIIYWHRELGDAGLTHIDLVHWGFNLHDYYHQNGGEARVQRILASARGALEPKGILAVSDHIGVAGMNNRKLHRVEIAISSTRLSKPVSASRRAQTCWPIPRMIIR